MLTLRLFKIKMHTRRVLILKRSLPVFAFLCVSVMMAWPALMQPKETLKVAKDEVQKSLNGAKVDMTQVLFFSADDKDQPFRVTAQTVQETDPERKIITLNYPKGDYVMNSGEILYGQAPYGFAFQKEEYLYFEQDVQASTKSGYTAKTDAVVIAYKKNTMESEADLFVTGPGGTLNSQGFLIEKSGDLMTFKKKTKTVIRDKEGDITITSKNGLYVDRVLHTITAVGSAVITQADKTIKGDKIVLYYTDNPDDRLKKAEAFGNVSAETPNERITGDQGDYDPKTSLIKMIGDVHLYQGSTQVTAPKAEMNLKTGVHTLLQDKSSGETRVKGSLIPSQVK